MTKTQKLAPNVTPRRHRFPFLLASLVVPALLAQSPGLQLNKKEYFEAPGIDVMAFQDIYPDGHQGGVSVIQNGVRVATNGDIRLDPAPGQWQPMPKQDVRSVDVARSEERRVGKECRSR